MAKEPEQVIANVADEAARQAAAETAALTTAQIAQRDAEANTAKTAAESTIVLATGTAAVAQQQAADQVRTYEERSETWRAELSQKVQALEMGLQQIPSLISTGLQGVEAKLSSLIQSKPLETVDPDKAVDGGAVRQDQKTEVQKPRRRWIG